MEGVTELNILLKLTRFRISSKMKTVREISELKFPKNDFQRNGL